MRFIAVLGPYLTPFDNEFSRISVKIFPVNEDVGGDFTENCIADTDAGVSLKIERIG